MVVTTREAMSEKPTLKRQTVQETMLLPLWGRANFSRLHPELLDDPVAEGVIAKIKVSAGESVLDFGCGIGSFTLPLARLVGNKGKVFAADREASALAGVEKIARRRNLAISKQSTPIVLPTCQRRVLIGRFLSA